MLSVLIMSNLIGRTEISYTHPSEVGTPVGLSGVAHYKADYAYPIHLH